MIMFPFGRFGNWGEFWPYTNIHNGNQDWLIGVVRRLMDEYPQFVKEVENMVKDIIPAPVNEGAVGDFLMNLGNGQTEWSPLDPNIIYTAVNQWLEDHPEATTTVQDGSITPAKLDPELYKIYKTSGDVQFFFPNLSTGGYSGSTALMVTPTKTVLFDTDAEYNRTPVIDYYTTLYNAGVFTNIDYIIISHYHGDHMQNLEAILQAFPHANCKMYIPISPSGYYIVTEEPQLITNYQTVVNVANLYSVAYTVVDSDRTVDIDSLTSIKLFNSTPEAYQYYSNAQARYNNYSMVSLVKIGNCYSMFPGDLENVGQQRVMTLVDLPRLFLYSMHHHGLMNNDYIPYLKAIDPLYNVISASHSSMVTNGTGGSGATNIMSKITTGFIGSQAYDSYSFTCNGSSGIITHGIDCKPASKSESTINYYVNNEYSGAIHDGTELHPFTNIAEAIMFVKTERNAEYNIYVQKTNTVYEGAFIRDCYNNVRVYGVNNPSIEYIYVKNCTHVYIRDVTFVGGYAGLPSNGASALVIFFSTVMVKNIVFDGTGIASNGSALALARSKLILNSSNISHYEYGNVGYDIEPSEVYVSGCTFSNVTRLFSTRLCKFYLLSGNTFTDVTTIMRGDIDNGIPFYARRGVMQIIYDKCSADAISEPCYFTSSNCAMIITNSKIYNILTGQEYTL